MGHNHFTSYMHGLLTWSAIAALPAVASSLTDTELKVNRITDGFAAVQADFNQVRRDLDDRIRVKLDVDPALLLLGEPMTVTLEARSAHTPNSKLEFRHDCYRQTGTLHTFELDWRKNASGDRFTATWTWKPTQCGNYLLHWKCDIGGDIADFWRNFSVIDNRYAVMILNSTSHASPRPEPDFHQLHLPFSFWWEPSLYGRRPTAEDFAGPSRGCRQFGDDPQQLIFNGAAYLPGNTTVFYHEPEAVQKSVLQCFAKLNAMFGLQRPVKSLLTYGMGNGPARVARSLGYDLIGALCADQNWQDGAFRINHWGMPARPYFLSQDDFRKPGPGGPKAVVGIQQCARQTMECRDYDCVYAFESAIAYAFDRYTGINRPRTVNDIILSREMDFLQCFVESAGQTATPLFFCCGFEFNGVWPEMAAINRRFMACLARKANDTPLAYTTATAVADFYRRHYRQTPESVLYLHDVNVGMTHSGKPANYPDTMEIENHMFRSVFIKGRVLPLVYYDYTSAWDYPDWGNEDIPRGPRGYLVPNTEDRFRITPRLLDTRLFKTASSVEDNGKETVVTIAIEAAHAQPNLALAVWDLPREYNIDPALFRLTGARRFVPVRAPYTHNLCGIVVADIKKGKNSICLALSTQPRAPEPMDFGLGGGVNVKVFQRDGSATAYLYAAGPSVGELHLAPVNGAPFALVPFESDEPVIVDQPMTIKIGTGKPQRLLGLTCEQLRKCFPSAQPLGPEDTLNALLSGIGEVPAVPKKESSISPE